MPLDPIDVLNTILERASRDGVDELTDAERRIFLVNRFLIELDIGGLSGMLYNLTRSESTGPSPLRQTVDAIKSFGRHDVASTLESALEIVERPVDANRRHSTWEDFLGQVDPEGELERIEARMPSCEGLWEAIEDAAKAHARGAV